MSLTNVADELAWATTELAHAGLPSAGVDARLLMQHVIGDDAALAGNPALTEEQVDHFREAVGRRVNYEPLQHITGVAYFGPIAVSVGPGVFVPRPETESVLDWAARLIGNRPARVYDFCSGSGALAISLATMAPQTQVTAVECEGPALDWLRRNVDRAPASVRNRLQVLAADVTSRSALAEREPADVIVANPPYIPEGDRELLPRDVLGVDPDSALFGGADGMSVIGPMVDRIVELLAPGGCCAIEHDENGASLVTGIVEAAGLVDVVSRNDLAGRPRFVTARRTGRMET